MGKEGGGLLESNTRGWTWVGLLVSGNWSNVEKVKGFCLVDWGMFFGSCGGERGRAGCVMLLWMCCAWKMGVFGLGGFGA